MKINCKSIVIFYFGGYWKIDGPMNLVGLFHQVKWQSHLRRPTPDHEEDIPDHEESTDEA